MQNQISPIVCLSGWGHGDGALRPLAQALSCSGSLRVHSLAACLSEPGRLATPELSSYAQGLRAALERTGRPAVVIGWSMGGCVALETALQHPALIKKLILISSTASFCRTAKQPFGVEAKILKAMIHGLKQRKRETLENFFSLVYSGVGLDQAFKTPLEEALTIPEQELIDGLKYLLNCDLSQRASQAEMPVLLIHAKDDQIIPWQASQYLHSLIAHSEMILIEGANHALAAVAPALVASKIETFLGQV